jgi:hypothetical protein
MELNIVEGFLLLALDNKKGKFLTDSLAINHGLAGATLMKLTILNKIEIREKRVYVIDSSPIETSYLDRVLEYINSAGKNHKVRYWVNRVASKWKRLRYDLIGDLMERGILTKQRRKFLGLFPYSVYPTIDDRPETELREKLLSIVNGKTEIDPKSLMLFSLLGATKLTRVLFSSRAEYRKGKERIKELTREFEINPLIHLTIKEVCSVVITASTSAAVRASVGRSAT